VFVDWKAGVHTPPQTVFTRSAARYVDFSKYVEVWSAVPEFSRVDAFPGGPFNNTRIKIMSGMKPRQKVGEAMVKINAIMAAGKQRLSAL
jgi:hypothetical protein